MIRAAILALVLIAAAPAAAAGRAAAKSAVFSAGQPGARSKATTTPTHQTPSTKEGHMAIMQIPGHDRDAIVFEYDVAVGGVFIDQTKLDATAALELAHTTRVDLDAHGDDQPVTIVVNVAPVAPAPCPRCGDGSACGAAQQAAYLASCPMRAVAA